MSNFTPSLNSYASWNGYDYSYIEDTHFHKELEKLFASPGAPTPLNPIANGPCIPLFSPSCEVDLVGDHFLINFDLPGVEMKNIRIEVRDHQLSVSGERTLNNEDPQGTFEFLFILPSGVTHHQIRAHYKDETLKLIIPKAEPAPSYFIKIEEEKSKHFTHFLGAPRDV